MAPQQNRVPGSFRFGGYLGRRIDIIADARIRNDTNRERIYPEIEEALRARVDDRLVEGAGKWQGEFWGKWILSAIAAERYYQDGRLTGFIHESARAVVATQDPDGYIGTYFDRDYFGAKTWNIWGRKYTLWGLVESYELLGDQKLLEAAAKLLDHLMTQVGPAKADIITTGQLNGLPSASILTPVMMLYRHTQEERFLDFGRWIVEQFGAHPEGPPDILRKGLSDTPVHTWYPDAEKWAKSYEFISCVEGMLLLYEETGNEELLVAAKNIHHRLVEWERSLVGSVSFNDKFIGSARLRNTLAEICDIVYWNRFSHRLLLLTGEARYADEIERSLYNGLLVGASADGRWGNRRLRVSHHHVKAHPQSALKYHHCCVDNLPRALFQAAEGVLLAEAGTIYCTLFNPGSGSVVAPNGDVIDVEIAGEYPFDNKATLRVTAPTGGVTSIAIRAPWWSTVQGTRGLAVDGSWVGADEAGWVRVPAKSPPFGDNASEAVINVAFANPLHTESFEPGGGISKETIDFHERQWVAIGYMKEENGKSLGQVKTLEDEDLAANVPAPMLFYGPVVLSMDGVDTPAIEPQELATADVSVDAGSPVPSVEVQAGGKSAKFKPFADTGSAWSPEDMFTCWTVR